MPVKEFEPGKKYIVVIEAGWVFQGFPSRKAGHVELDKAENIRQWGTTAGLGQIALQGPTAETQLDNYGMIKIPESKILFTIPCEA